MSSKPGYHLPDRQPWHQTKSSWKMPFLKEENLHALACLSYTALACRIMRIALAFLRVKALSIAPWLSCLRVYEAKTWNYNPTTLLTAIGPTQHRLFCYLSGPARSDVC
jgi:hypothetical protein